MKEWLDQHCFRGGKTRGSPVAPGTKTWSLGRVVSSRPSLLQAIACDDRCMRWIVNLNGSRGDIERLLAESLERLAATDDPCMVRLEIVDPRHPKNSDEARSEGRAMIDGTVRHLNGFGRLRWGRSFGGIDAGGISYVDSDGRHGQVVFVDTGYAYLEPEEFSDLVERLGTERPTLPNGLSDIRALDARRVLDLTETRPEIARVLRLIDLMLVPDGQIEWAAGYATLEVIEQSARDYGVDGESLGWWEPTARQRFRQMANSFEAVGIQSRHPGLRNRAPKKLMAPNDGAWFVRAVATRWINWLSGEG